jgi:hypothetical protein
MHHYNTSSFSHSTIEKVLKCGIVSQELTGEPCVREQSKLASVNPGKDPQVSEGMGCYGTHDHRRGNSGCFVYLLHDERYSPEHSCPDR